MIYTTPEIPGTLNNNTVAEKLTITKILEKVLNYR